MSNNVSVVSADYVTTVTLESMTMPLSFFTDVGKAFEAVARDPQVRAVVLRGSGKAFSYGLDLPAAAAEIGSHLIEGGKAAARTELLATIRHMQASFDAVAKCPVPVIAAIHGRCIGSGIDLVSACDIRLASRDAMFSVRETKVAIIADMGTLQRLPAIIGQGHTRELAFTGKDIDAERAREIGLVNDLYDDRAALDAAARSMALEIAANPPLTVRGVKDVLAFGEGKTVADGLAYVAAWNSAFLASDDLIEAMGAFVEKRAPAFRGR